MMLIDELILPTLRELWRAGFLRWKLRRPGELRVDGFWRSLLCGTWSTIGHSEMPHRCADPGEGQPWEVDSS
jgi:hypothetical protein